MVRRQYTEQDKASALAYVDANGGNIEKTAKQTGYPRKTIEYWVRGNVNEDVAKLRRIKKGALADRYEDAAQLLVEHVPDKIEEASLASVATSIGILTDKMRLLRDEPTAINKNEHAIPGEDAILAAAEEIRFRRLVGDAGTGIASGVHEGDLSEI